MVGTPYTSLGIIVPTYFDKVNGTYFNIETAMIQKSPFLNQKKQFVLS